MKQKTIAAAPVLPETGLIRVNQILLFLNVHRATLYRMIKDGRFPEPAKLGWISVWRIETFNQWLDKNAPLVELNRRIITQQ